MGWAVDIDMEEMEVEVDLGACLVTLVSWGTCVRGSRTS